MPLRGRPRPSRLAAGIATLRGAGPRLAEAASEIGVESLGDLLWHVPHGYRDRSQLSEIAELRLGQEATLLVEVRSVRVRPTRRRRLTILEATVADGSGPTKAVWFNQPWLAEQLDEGTRVLVHGKLDKAGFKVDAHEVVRGEGDGDSPTGLHTTGIVPVHPASGRLRPQKIRDWEWQARGLARDAIEALPAPLRVRRGLASAADALAAVHFPADAEEVSTARERLAFEELFLHQAALASRRGQHDAARRAPVLDPPGELTRGWLASLPFELTGDQRRAVEEVDADLGSERPMQRLLMGEVGSGKTACALYAMLRAVESGHQAALMAPTETLAEQHFQTLERLLAGAGLPSAALLTGSTPAARRREHARPPRHRPAPAGRRHPRADRGRGRVRAAGASRRRRAAPLRGPPARRARRQGAGRRRAAHPAHDRDADSADAVADRVRRSRRDGAPRAARRPASR